MILRHFDQDTSRIFESAKQKKSVGSYDSTFSILTSPIDFWVIFPPKSDPVLELVSGPGRLPLNLYQAKVEHWGFMKAAIGKETVRIMFCGTIYRSYYGPYFGIGRSLVHGCRIAGAGP